MKIEQVQRNDNTKTTMIVLTADEGKKLINQDFIDGIVEEPIICSKVFLGVNASESDYTEITEEEADKYQEKYDQKSQNKTVEE